MTVVATIERQPRRDARPRGDEAPPDFHRRDTSRGSHHPADTRDVVLRTRLHHRPARERDGEPQPTEISIPGCQARDRRARRPASSASPPPRVDTSDVRSALDGQRRRARLCHLSSVPFKANRVRRLFKVRFLAQGGCDLPLAECRGTEHNLGRMVKNKEANGLLFILHLQAWVGSSGSGSDSLQSLDFCVGALMSSRHC